MKRQAVPITGTFRLSINAPDPTHDAASDAREPDLAANDNGACEPSGVRRPSGIDRLIAELASLDTLTPEAVENLCPLIGADSIEAMAQALPWYVIASAHPGELLGPLLTDEPERFEALSLRLVAYRAYAAALAAGEAPRAAATRVARAQHRRILDDLDTRYGAPEGGERSMLLDTDVHTAAGDIDETRLRVEINRLLSYLDIDPANVDILILPDTPTRGFAHGSDATLAADDAGNDDAGNDDAGNDDETAPGTGNRRR